MLIVPRLLKAVGSRNHTHYKQNDNLPPISGIESFSSRETDEGMQRTANASASIKDECGATVRIGASSEVLSLPLTLTQ